MDIHNEFIANRKNLVFYSGKPIMDRVHTFTDIDGNPYDFSEALNFTFKIWQEREGGLLMISWGDTNLSASDNNIILNAQDTDIETGKYYYEMAYLIAGGYEVLIAFGEAKFI